MRLSSVLRCSLHSEGFRAVLVRSISLTRWNSPWVFFFTELVIHVSHKRSCGAQLIVCYLLFLFWVMYVFNAWYIGNPGTEILSYSVADRNCIDYRFAENIWFIIWSLYSCVKYFNLIQQINYSNSKKIIQYFFLFVGILILNRLMKMGLTFL